MALSTNGSNSWYPTIGTTINGVNTTITVSSTSWPGGVAWRVSDGGEWMAHPKTAAEIIDEFARELAVMRPA